MEERRFVSQGKIDRVCKRFAFIKSYSNARRTEYSIYFPLEADLSLSVDADLRNHYNTGDSVYFIGRNQETHGDCSFVAVSVAHFEALVEGKGTLMHVNESWAHILSETHGRIMVLSRMARPKLTYDKSWKHISRDNLTNVFSEGTNVVYKALPQPVRHNCSYLAVLLDPDETQPNLNEAHSNNDNLNLNSQNNAIDNSSSMICDLMAFLVEMDFQTRIAYAFEKSLGLVQLKLASNQIAKSCFQPGSWIQLDVYQNETENKEWTGANPRPADHIEWPSNTNLCVSGVGLVLHCSRGKGVLWSDLIGRIYIDKECECSLSFNENIFTPLKSVNFKAKYTKDPETGGFWMGASVEFANMKFDSDSLITTDDMIIGSVQETTGDMYSEQYGTVSFTVSDMYKPWNGKLNEGQGALRMGQRCRVTMSPDPRLEGQWVALLVTPLCSDGTPLREHPNTFNKETVDQDHSHTLSNQWNSDYRNYTLEPSPLNSQMHWSTNESLSSISSPSPPQMSCLTEQSIISTPPGYMLSSGLFVNQRINSAPNTNLIQNQYNENNNEVLRCSLLQQLAATVEGDNQVLQLIMAKYPQLMIQLIRHKIVNV